MITCVLSHWYAILKPADRKAERLIDSLCCIRGWKSHRSVEIFVLRNPLWLNVVATLSGGQGQHIQHLTSEQVIILLKVRIQPSRAKIQHQL